MMKRKFVTLNDGNKIPQFGLGVYMVRGELDKSQRFFTMTLAEQEAHLSQFVPAD